MNGREPIDRFDFNDQAPFNEELRPEGVADGNPLVDVDRLLPFHNQTGASKA